MCSNLIGQNGGGDGSGHGGAAVDPYELAITPGAPRFYHEKRRGPGAVGDVGGDPETVNELGLVRNETELRIALAVVPSSLDADVENHIALVSSALGVSRSVAMTYVDVGMELQRMPRFLKVLRHRRHLTLAHLRAIAAATLPIRDESVVRQIESRLASFVLPRRDGEVLRGVRSLMKFLQRVIEEESPLLRPRDLPGEGESLSSLEAACGYKPGESISYKEDGALTAVNMELDSLRAFEFREVLKQIAVDKTCTQAEALSHLVHGTVESKVVLNLYCPLTEEQPKTAWVGGHGWISEIATEFWLDRVTGIQLMADETVDRYTPSQRQRAYVQGRDGTCRFPGCSVDATKCDLDHIEAYDHENPSQGGKTSTQNLHCLCRAHHNMKTTGLWFVNRHVDGTEVWTSSTSGEKLISLDDGPLAGHGRYSFDVRGLRIGQTLTEYNERREQLYAESRLLSERARQEIEDRRTAETEREESEECPF